ncbi:MAG: hypothetical protein CBB97_21865 [Candidatus Endolissoclinum sp. TMED37]|nr:MAG: hypothetical protein CBB97_21865 [Candidatus Endolissoclinum sp. TMED37]|tara:strand:+ start:779 stop:2491 length:1713 start_codon:yes stop_codon:yes gene_type:complete
MVWKNIGKNNIWTIEGNKQIYNSKCSSESYVEYVKKMVFLNRYIIQKIYFIENNNDIDILIGDLIEESLIDDNINEFIDYGKNEIIYKEGIEMACYIDILSDDYDYFRDKIGGVISLIQSRDYTFLIGELSTENEVIPYSCFIKLDDSYYFCDPTLISNNHNYEDQIISCNIAPQGIIYGTFKDLMVRYISQKDNYKNNDFSTDDTSGVSWVFNELKNLSMLEEDSNSSDSTLDSNLDSNCKSIKIELIKYTDEEICKICSNTQKLDDIMNIPNDCDNEIIQRIISLKTPITMLQQMMGFDDIKKQLFDMAIMFCIQQIKKPKPHQRLHSIVYGGAGTGKTTFANILAHFFCKLNFIKKPYVHHVKSSDLIGEYVGHTAPKVEKAVKKAMGGVLLIDEAYTIGYGGSKETNGSSFAQECLDALNRNLSEHGDEFVCILAGYKDAIENNVMRLNRGLERRFNFRFEMPTLTGVQLYHILKQKVGDNILDVTDNEAGDFFDKNPLPYQGGDIENLAVKIEIIIARRIFTNANFLNDNEIKVTLKDIKDAYKLSFGHRNALEENEKCNLSMYL